MPVHLHGAYFVSFLLLTGRCYDAETSVILLLLDRAFAFCKVLERSSFHQNFEETKDYSPGFFFRVPKKCVDKSNPSESKRKEKLNGAWFSCIVHVRREL